LLSLKDCKLSEKENQIKDVKRAALRASMDFESRKQEMENAISAEMERRDGFSFGKVLQEKLRKEEEEFVQELKEQHWDRCHQIDRLVGLDGGRRELVFRVMRVFEESKGRGMVEEFMRFLEIIEGNVREKGEGFLSNGFVNYL
jgi:hypothetical protein